MKHREEFIDDGRTICSMDVEGMPSSPVRLNRAKRREDKSVLQEKVNREEPLTRSEYRRYTWYAVLAGLTVVGIIGGVLVLFILILTLIW